MSALVNLYSNDNKEIQKFLHKYYNNTNMSTSDDLKWEKNFENPIEIADFIGIFIDNNDKFNVNMWISLDRGLFVNVTDHNSDKIIRYLFERYPY